MSDDWRDLTLLQTIMLLMGALPETVGHVKYDHKIDWRQHLADLFQWVGNSETVFYTNI
jgi:hypothetical protein